MKDDIIKMLHKHQELPDENILESKKEQRGCLCSNNTGNRCSFLEYKQTDISIERINKAFDILFEEMRRRP